MAGCGKLDSNGKAVSGSPLPCGTRLTFGVGKETKRTETHLCRECAKEEGNGTEQMRTSDVQGRS